MTAADRARALRALLPAALLAAALAFIALPADAANVEVRRLADTASLGPIFSYDVDASGAVLLLTRDNIVDAGSGEPMFGNPLRRPAWISLAGGKLMFLAEGALFAVEGRNSRKLVEVPLANPVAASDGRRTFLAGITPKGRSVLFLFKEGEGHKPLLELDAPVDAMVFLRDALLFTAGSRIFALKEGGKAALLADIPGMPVIASLAVDDRDGTIYFSDAGSTYAMRGGDFVVVRSGMGGILRFRDGSLYVLSLRDKALFRLSGLPNAFSFPGALAPMKDPCSVPVVSLYCDAEERRARLKTAERFGKVQGVDAGDLPAYAEEQRKALGQAMAAIEKEAAAGKQAVLWGGGNEPRAVGANTPVATGKKGAGLDLWDGTAVRIGPDSKALLVDCAPSKECRQSLEKGLLYVETPKRAAEGSGNRKPAQYTVVAGAMTLSFESAKVALFASGESAVAVVIEGRIKASSSRGGSVIVASGESIEVKGGEPPGMPRAADMERLNRWWEGIR